jgi:hypothetical protein
VGRREEEGARERWRIKRWEDGEMEDKEMDGRENKFRYTPDRRRGKQNAEQSQRAKAKPGGNGGGDGDTDPRHRHRHLKVKVSYTRDNPSSIIRRPSILARSGHEVTLTCARARACACT